MSLATGDERIGCKVRLHPGLRCVLVGIVLSLGASQTLAGPAPSGAAKPYNHSAISETQAGRTAGGDRVPEGLSASQWSSIRAAYEARRHSAFAVDGGYQTRNPSQQWRTHFDGRGFLTTPDAGGWSWGLQLLRYGRAGAEQTVTTPSCVEADGARVSYSWDDTLTEWYVNDGRGLEHGYTIQRPPAPSQSDRSFTVAALNNPADSSMTVEALNDAHERGSHTLNG